MKVAILILGIAIILSITIASAAHYIVGYVEDAVNGESANGKTVVLWNQDNGIADNVTDIVGPTGNSNTNNVYLIDCELLQTPCALGDNMTVQILFSEGYFSNATNVTVTGAGFDLVENLTLNAPTNITNVEVDDDLRTPESEIDLSVATTKLVWCAGVIEDANGEAEIQNVSGTFFDNTVSYTNPDDNNDHYTNASCFVNTSYGTATQVHANCTFNIAYYANPTTWNCTLQAHDRYNYSYLQSNTTIINELLGIGVNSPVHFGITGISNLSDERVMNITNYGNTRINISLDAYGSSPGDNLSMTCNNSNIPIEHQKFNLTTSSAGPLDLNEILNNYTNLSTNIIIGHLNLSQRTNDLVNDANKSTYWRVYAPYDVGGNCTGFTILGATTGEAT